MLFLVAFLFAALGVVGLFLFSGRANFIFIESNNTLKEAEAPEHVPPSGSYSALRGEMCESGDRRPFAVMLAEDTSARPLSAIGMADLVVEMPVITGGINRMMAFFQCSQPSEIGSVRSARHDFIPFVAAFDGIYAHWGGSHYALDELRGGAVDNIDALPNPFEAFWRKRWVPAPHNGFTSFENLKNAAEGIGYRMENRFGGYPRIGKDGGDSETGTLRILYTDVVEYQYDPQSSGYSRWRSGRKEIDALTQKQVQVDAIIVMRAASRQIERDYNDVDIEGGGEAIIFQKGGAKRVRWQKEKAPLSSKLFFLDEQSREVELVRGFIWVQVAEPFIGVQWRGESF